MDGMNNSGGHAASTGYNAFFIVTGWISAVLSLFFPLIAGVLGVIMGILATKSGSKAGISVIVASIILMGIGLIFSKVLMNYTRHFLGI